MSTGALELGPREQDHYLSFVLGELRFAIDVASVRRVVDGHAPERALSADAGGRATAAAVARGAPIVDLARELGLPQGPRSATPCLVLLGRWSSRETKGTGAALLVDRVERVSFVPRFRILAPPRLPGGCVLPPQISGLFAEGERFVLVVDPERILASAEPSSAAGSPPLRPAG